LTQCGELNMWTGEFQIIEEVELKAAFHGVLGGWGAQCRMEASFRALPGMLPGGRQGETSPGRG
jgi:hypothetical protein